MPPGIKEDTTGSGEFPTPPKQDDKPTGVGGTSPGPKEGQRGVTPGGGVTDQGFTESGYYSGL